ncbi:MAG TPA: antibiotic biosynthesis monooxygenase [Acidimicrobiales bacterium]|nr:antibiotic biosynthesis monooxygenase [Acidimicrobiales bacterium]
MVIVQGVFWVDPDQVAAFVEGRKATMDASRDDRGCLEYVFAADPLTPGRVILSERWESRQALEEHGAAGRARAEAAGHPAPAVEPLRREIVAYEVSDSWPLG